RTRCGARSAGGGWSTEPSPRPRGTTQERRRRIRRRDTESGGCGVCGLPQLAEVYDRQGQADSARALYERYVETPGLLRWRIDPAELAASYKRLGELYEARNDRKRAAGYYGKFVDLWKDADAELQPGVREVRARLA